ncbi:MAG: PucR family transcriptional regulator ligand-binding domain-containing protein [Candidatus Bathyarchaeota archaeon]|nr:PucR family transcriptional regulator ligand-binding domain-containing protein [Candidatus Bathyarchaeota archaeon]
MICEEILRLPSLKDLKMVAGREGLDRPVRWVYVAECFEDPRQVVDWLYGGELVIMTGLGIKGDADILAELVEKIAGKKITVVPILRAGLGDRNLDSAGVATLRDIIIRTGALARTEARIADLTESSLRALNGVPLAGGATERLTDLALAATHRTL